MTVVGFYHELIVALTGWAGVGVSRGCSSKGDL